MKKKYYLLILAFLTLAGSLFGVLASNMLFDDLFNIEVPFTHSTLFVSLPAVTITVLFLLGILYVIRTYRHPGCLKRYTGNYLIIALVFSVLGVVGAVLSGVLVYHTFVGAHPFAEYLIIFLALNVIAICGEVCGLVMIRKWEDDKDKVKVNFKYVMKTIGWVLFIGYVFNKTGLFLGFPIYVYWRNFYLTFPVYLYLLVPLTLGVLLVLYNFGYLNKKQLKLSAFIMLGVNVALFAYTVINGLISTAFVSSISQLMPISRMASLPIEIIIHFLSYTGVAVAMLVISRENKEVKE